MPRYTVVYMHNRRMPTATFTIEVVAESHADALFKFVNMPGTDNAFVCATVEEVNWPAEIVKNTGPQVYPSSVLVLTREKTKRFLKKMMRFK